LLKWLATLAAVFTVDAVGFTLPSVGAHPTLPLLAELRGFEASAMLSD
jgi:hypothetical protein